MSTSSIVGKPFRILIADDDTDDVQLTKDCFEDSEMQVHINDFGDGQVLVDYLKSITEVPDVIDLPQLILLDINMPRMGGFEALQEIKQIVALQEVPVVIFSTSKATKDIERAYELGASSFIDKPNSYEEWHDKMSKLLRLWTSKQPLTD